MKLIQLTEGLSSILYHSTTLQAAATIVASNKFKLSATYANSSELDTGSKKLFFLSTTRSKTGGYTIANAYPSNFGTVVMVLDGQELSYNYSGDPVEYWGRSILKSHPKKNEMEDRVYNDEPFIPNATKYIKEIHILLKDAITPRARKSFIILKKSNIPIWIYNNEQSFVLQDKRNAKSLSDFELEPPMPPERYPRADRIAFNKQQRRRERKLGDTKIHNKLSYGMSRWIKLMATPVDQFDSLGTGLRNYIRDLQRYDGGDSLRVLQADIHNASKDPYWNKKLAPIMRKNGLRSAKDILDFIKERWKPVVSEE